ncbi:beta strand repeat-containing protein [Azonexus sp.]|uniref:beta strand repeat-containing protein n=1 Tax=Azonexus sp. TaxID=1872668 RepID=UPI0039E50EC4
MAERKPLVRVGGKSKQLPAGDSLSKSVVGLGNVTNDAQAKASIYPNTTPAAGRILVGQTSGKYESHAMAGDATISESGLVTISNGAATNAKQGAMPAGTVKGNKHAVAAAPQDLTPAEARTVLGLGTAAVVNTGTGPSDAILGNDTRLSDSRAPTAHSHGNITNVGAIGTTANLPVITTTSGVLTTGAFGTGATNFAAGNHNHNTAYAPIDKGVTNGDAHDHSGGDGAQIAYSSLSGLPTLGTAAPLNVAASGNAAAGEVVKGNDTRLSDAREWIAPTTTQAQAEDGNGTTRLAWTGQRVRQAIAAWWNSITNIDGKNIGATTPGTGRFTTLATTGNTALGDSSTNTVTVNGYMGVGGAGNASYAVHIQNAALTGGSQYGVVSAPTSSVAATSTTAAFGAIPATAANAYTATNVVGLYAFNATKGAGSTIANQHGVLIADQTQGINNYGITSQVSAGTNKRNLNITGTADNYLAGNVGIGIASPGTKLHVGSAASIYTGEINADNSIAAFKNSGNQATIRVIAASYGNASEANLDLANFASKNLNFRSGFRLSGGVGAGETTANEYFAVSAIAISSNGTISSTERLRINSAGQLGIGLTPTARNNTILQIVDGIGFPATQVASSDPNTLDDYEEGTFTPVARGQASAGVGTYGVQLGKYTKIGRNVFFQILITWTAHTGTGNLQITGLPFITSSDANSQSYFTVVPSDLTYSGDIAANVQPGSDLVQIYSFASNSPITQVGMYSSAGIRIAGFYSV